MHHLLHPSPRSRRCPLFAAQAQTKTHMCCRTLFSETPSDLMSFPHTHTTAAELCSRGGYLGPCSTVSKHPDDVLGHVELLTC